MANIPLDRIYFIEDGHKYVDNLNLNRQLLSASAIKSKFKYNGLSKIPKKILSKAQRRGTKIHYHLENYLSNGIVWNDKSDHHYMIYRKLKTLFDDTKLIPAYEEQLLYYVNKFNDIIFTGTADIIAKIPNTTTYILGDWKTSSKKGDYYFDWCFQLSLYYIGLKQLFPDLIIVNRVIFWSNGKDSSLIEVYNKDVDNLVLEILDYLSIGLFDLEYELELIKKVEDLAVIVNEMMVDTYGK